MKKTDRPSGLAGYVDSDGVYHEVSNGFIIFPRQHNGFYEGWFAMAQRALMELASSETGLGKEAYQVLFSILAVLDFQNLINVNQAEIAKKIGIKKQQFNRALRKLEEKSIILRGPKVGKSLTYRLNPNFGWKGSAKEHKKALRERMERSNISSVISKDENSH